MTDDSNIPLNQGMREEQLPLVVAVDLGGTQIRTAVLRGKTLYSRVGLLTGKNPTPERIIPRVYAAVQEAIDKADRGNEPIAGIGIAAPGPLDYKTGVIYTPPNLPAWRGVPLGDMMMQRFGLPVFVENDAHAAGLGEYLFGAGRGCGDMVYLTISTGIGGGIISNGRIMEGASGTAGELGHMTVDWRGERCSCGNIGCLEAIASGTAIARQANEALAAGRADDLLVFLKSQQPEAEITARVVAAAAAAGIISAQVIIMRAAEALGVGLVNIIHSLNPEVIVLGGGVTQMGDLLLEPALRLVRERTMSVPRTAARITLAELGVNTGLIGAGALIYYYSRGDGSASPAAH
jgi:glucokinase